MTAKYMTAVGVSALIGYSPRFVRRHASDIDRTGTSLFGKRISGRWRFLAEDVWDWIRRLGFPDPPSKA